MANVDRPNGLRVIGTKSGSPWQAAVKEYVTDGSHAAIFTGSMVEMTSDGYIDVYAPSGVDFIGVCVGVRPAAAGRTNLVTDNFLSSSTPTLHPGGYSVANTAGDVVQVCIAPDALYEVQEDNAVADLAIADIGLNIEITTESGSTTTGTSTQELDSDSAATTATLPLRIVGPVDRPDNAIGTSAKWIVTPANAHWLGQNLGV